MKIQQFLEHHGIGSNPFADEDAQTDQVFKGGCIRAIYHPAWDKIYGDPADPATAVVFGEKGSGKTALRLQLIRHLADFNADHPEHQVLVTEYDDFNPYLDRFRERLGGRRRTEKMLERWRLWDHMDAILALAVTQVVDRALEVRDARHPAARDEPLPLENLERSQARDLLLLATLYDQSTAENRRARWHELRRKLKVAVWQTKWDWAVGILVTAAVLALIGWMGWWEWMLTIWPYLAIAAGWAPRIWHWLKWTWTGRKIARSMRVLNQSTTLLRRLLGSFGRAKIEGQPLPAAQRTDDRYELLTKLQGVLRSMKLPGVIVVVDRLDEPYLINGSTELMQLLLWPMLDNKLLKHSGLGLKLLLPIELERLLDRQDRDFHQRARLDKQNMIRSLAWTGQSLYDMAQARLTACSTGGQPTLTDLFDDSVSRQRLVDAFSLLRVPRNLFKFMYRLLTTHCNAHSDTEPAWQITSGTFESVLAVYQRDQDAFDRGVGAG